LYKDVVYFADRSSCHNCLRRCCTLRSAIHRTVCSRTEKFDVMTFVSQLDPQTSTWFDFSAEDSSRTVEDLAYSVASRRSSSSLQLYVPLSSFFRVQQCRTPSTNWTRSCSDELLQRKSVINNVELHRQSYTATSSLPVNNVELHRQVSSQWCLHSTMSNSIDQPSRSVLCSVLR